MLLTAKSGFSPLLRVNECPCWPWVWEVEMGHLLAAAVHHSSKQEHLVCLVLQSQEEV